MKTKLKRLQLPLVFAGIVFLIIVSAMTIAMLCFIVLYYFNLLEILQPKAWYFSLLIQAVICIVTGTVLAVLFSWVPLKPIREIIAATNRMAEGDFDVRIHLRGPEELQKLNQSFNHMAQELGSIEMLRTDFVNNFSHEFKTPIVSVRGFAKMLRTADLTQEEREEYLNIIIDESERLSSLAENVLNLSRIETQTMLSGQTVFNVSEQIRIVAAMLEKEWYEKKLEISLEGEEISICGNEELLKQVWINLLNNAVKFSPEYGTVSIKITVEGGEAIITFLDQGEGMTKEIQEHIFDKFYQGDSSHATKGNGLGLTLCKKIVGLHRGSIQVACTGREGTAFEVRLPQKSKILPQAAGHQT